LNNPHLKNPYRLPDDWSSASTSFLRARFPSNECIVMDGPHLADAVDRTMSRRGTSMVRLLRT
jgi:hypothetical protein